MIERLKIQFESRLPGQQAQLQMAPSGRKTVPTPLERDKAKSSAVLIALFPENDDWKFSLMRRNSYPGVHSGQISLPGGQVDPSDQNLEQTALREYMEETGDSIQNINILGSLTELYIPPSNFLVHPVVGYMEDLPTFKPDDREVEELLHLSVGDFIAMNFEQTHHVNISTGARMNVPGFKIDGHLVWGATAMILAEFREVLKNATL